MNKCYLRLGNEANSKKANLATLNLGAVHDSGGNILW